MNTKLTANSSISGSGSGSTIQPHDQHKHEENSPSSHDKSIDPLSNVILKRVGTDSQSVSHSGSPTISASQGSASINDQQSSEGQIQSQQANGNSNTLNRANSINANKFLNPSNYPKEHENNINTNNNNNVATTTTTTSNTKKPGTKDRGFFSKLLKSSARPTSDDEQDSTTLDKRDEGWNADVYGFVPNYPTPPKFIHVRAHRKQKREFNRVFLAQELNKKERKHHHHHHFHDNASKLCTIDHHTDGKTDGSKDSDKDSCPSAIWCAKFSQDGKYMASAGEDKVIRIWQVLSTNYDREEFEDDDESEMEDNASGYRSRRHRDKKKMYAPVFKSEPIREYYGHTSDVLDLSWSKNNFLLSSSMDKTVRLWHIDRSECLCSFLHSDFVTSIQFHPTDDRFFLSGSLDCKLRLWSIPDKEIAYWKDVPDLITAVAFSPDGLTAIAGCFGGQCLFYETDGLNFQSQMHVRSSRGKNSKGSKITGIQSFLLPSNIRYQGSFDSETKLLISTNDSRVRMYNLYDKSMEIKFKGHENEQSQIRASFSDSGEYIISGSEDNRTYIWRVIPQKGNAVNNHHSSSSTHSQNSQVSHRKKDIQEYEYFHSNKNAVTVALFAPTATKKILALSEDPVYDLCDPPPVRLLPKGVTIEDDASSLLSSAPTNSRKSSHPTGNIFICADSAGCIKVFRQDCAYDARRAFGNNLYNTTSLQTTSSKRISTALSPTTSWRDSLSIHGSRSRSLRNLSPSSRANNRASSPVSTRNISHSKQSAGHRVPSSTTHVQSPLYEHSRQHANGNSTNNHYVSTRPNVSSGLNSSASSPPSSRRGSITDGLVRPLSTNGSGGSSLGRPRGLSTSSRTKSPLSSSEKVYNDQLEEESEDDEDELECTNCGSTSFKAKKVGGKMKLMCRHCNFVNDES